MKTSNKFLILALATFLVLLALYNVELKAAYKKRDFTDEFYNYSKLDNKDFDEIYVEAGNVIDVKIVRADKFDIRLRKHRKFLTLLNQQGGRLYIDVADSLANFNDWGDRNEIVIFCPALKRIVMNGQKMSYYEHSDSLKTDVLHQFDRRTVLEGFNLNSLTVSLGAANTLKLNNNKIKTLSAQIGDNEKGASKLTVGSDNVIDIANFNVADKCELILSNPEIKKIDYSFSTKAEITLKGSALKLLRK